MSAKSLLIMHLFIILHVFCFFILNCKTISIKIIRNKFSQIHFQLTLTIKVCCLILSDQNDDLYLFFFLKIQKFTELTSLSMSLDAVLKGRPYGKTILRKFPWLWQCQFFSVYKLWYYVNFNFKIIIVINMCNQLIYVFFKYISIFTCIT